MKKLVAYLVLGFGIFTLARGEDTPHLEANGVALEAVDMGGIEPGPFPPHFLGFGIFTLARGEDTPHLEFVKQLRVKKYNDLALRYLDILEKKGSPEVVAFIPIERASIYLDQAQLATSNADRTRQYDKARAGFEAFIKKSKAKSPDLAAIAQLESSRILGLQGRGRLVRTRPLNGGALVAEMTRILGMFEDANVQLELAGKALDDRLRDKKLDPKSKMAQALEQARLQADLEIALNLLDQALTYEGLNKGLTERGKKIDAALKQFKDLFSRDPRGALGQLGRAWIIKCYSEVDQINEAKKTYDDVMADKNPNSESAQRLARFFYFQMLTGGRNVAALKLAIKAKTEEDLQNEIQKVGREWTRLYPSHVNSFEGNTIRFELANSIRSKGDAYPKVGKDKDQLDARAKPFYEEAVRLYEDLAAVDTEYGPEVNGYHYQCMIALADSGTAVMPGEAKKITSFDGAISASKRGGISISREEDRIYSLEKKKARTKDEDTKLAEMKKGLAKKRKDTMKGVEEVLLRALELYHEGKAPKAKNKDLLEAHANLAWVLLTNGDLHRAVIIGEHAAHLPAADPAETKQAAQAAAWALQAYVQLISKGTKEGYPKEMVESDRERFRRLVDYMEVTWKDDPATDSARHQLGSQMLADKNFKGAEDVLSRISDRYNADGLIDARRRWAIACIELSKEGKTDADKKKYRDNSIKALRSVPELTNTSGPDTAAAYVGCKIMLGSILFESKEYTELDRMAAALKAQIPGLKIDAAEKENLQRTAAALANYAKYGRANTELQAGNYQKALAMAEEALKPVSDSVKKVRVKQGTIRKEYDPLVEKFDTMKASGQKMDPKQLQRMEELKEELDNLNQSVARDAELQRGLVLVALRATVQDGNRAKARVLLDQLLEEAKSDKVGLNVLVQLVAQLKKQIDDLKEKSDAKSKAQLTSLVSNFTSFLDAMAKQKNLDGGLIFFLANSYSSVGTYGNRNLHADAAKLLEQVKEPKPVPGVKTDPKAEGLFHAARLMTVRELRMAKKFPEARKVLDSITSQPWGKGFSVKKEKPLILMEEGKYGAAAVAWKNVIAEFGGRPDFNNAQLKENYFESYYQYIYCRYMYGKTMNNPKNITAAAAAIVKLEVTPPGDMGGESFKKRYQELLTKEPALKKDYDAAKKEKGPAGK